MRTCGKVRGKPWSKPRGRTGSGINFLENRRRFCYRSRKCKEQGCECLSLSQHLGSSCKLQQTSSPFHCSLDVFSANAAEETVATLWRQSCLVIFFGPRPVFLFLCFIIVCIQASLEINVAVVHQPVTSIIKSRRILTRLASQEANRRSHLLFILTPNSTKCKSFRLNSWALWAASDCLQLPTPTRR